MKKIPKFLIFWSKKFQKFLIFDEKNLEIFNFWSKNFTTFLSFSDNKEEEILEDQMNDLALESTKEQEIIQSDLFQQMIEVNFPEKPDISYAAHNFTGIDLATESTDLTDISLLPMTSIGKVQLYFDFWHFFPH